MIGRLIRWLCGVDDSRARARLERIQKAERETRPIFKRVDELDGRMDLVEEKLGIRRRREAERKRRA